MFVVLTTLLHLQQLTHKRPSTTTDNNSVAASDTWSEEFEKMREDHLAAVKAYNSKRDPETQRQAEGLEAQYAVAEWQNMHQCCKVNVVRPWSMFVNNEVQGKPSTLGVLSVFSATSPDTPDDTPRLMRQTSLKDFLHLYEPLIHTHHKTCNKCPNPRDMRMTLDFSDTLRGMDKETTGDDGDAVGMALDKVLRKYTGTGLPKHLLRKSGPGKAKKSSSTSSETAPSTPKWQMFDVVLTGLGEAGKVFAANPTQENQAAVMQALAHVGEVYALQNFVKNHKNEAANAPLMIVSGKFGTPPDFVDRSNVEAAHQDYLRRVETSVVDNDVHTTLRLYSLPLAWHHLACKTCPDPIDWAARLWSGEDVFGQGASAGEGSGASKAKGNGGNSGQDDTAGAGGKTAEATVSSHGRQESSTEKCGEGKDIADESEFSSWLLNRE